MNKILSAIFLSAVSLWQVQAQGIIFETGDWASIKAKAQAIEKPIFMDVYAEWCGPCKYMSKTIFTNAAVGEFMNANYVNYKLDAEAGEGPKLSELFKIKGYPTLLFFNAQSELVHQFIGAPELDEFMTLTKNSLLPEHQYFTLKKQFDLGERDKGFLKKYLSLAIGIEDNILPLMEIYWKTLSTAEQLEETNLALFIQIVFDAKSPLMQNFISNRTAYEKTLGREKIEAYTNEVLAQSLSAAQGAGILTEKNFKAFAKDFYPLFKDKKYVDAKVPFLFYANQEVTSKEIYKQSDKYFSQYASWEEIVSLGLYRFYSDDKFPYQQALKWANRAVSLNSNLYTHLFRGNILEKLGKNKAAIEDLVKVKAIYGEIGEDITEIQDRINKLSK